MLAERARAFARRAGRATSRRTASRAPPAPSRATASATARSRAGSAPTPSRRRSPATASVTIKLPLGDVTVGAAARHRRARARLRQRQGAHDQPAELRAALGARGCARTRSTARSCAIGLAEADAVHITDVVACPGTDYCSLAITKSMGVAARIRAAPRADAEPRRRPTTSSPQLGRFEIKISGLPELVRPAPRRRHRHDRPHGDGQGRRRAAALLAPRSAAAAARTRASGTRMDGRIPEEETPAVIAAIARHYLAERGAGRELPRVRGARRRRHGRQGGAVRGAGRRLTKRRTWPSRMCRLAALSGSALLLFRLAARARRARGVSPSRRCPVPTAAATKTGRARADSSCAPVATTGAGSVSLTGTWALLAKLAVSPRGETGRPRFDLPRGPGAPIGAALARADRCAGRRRRVFDRDAAPLRDEMAHRDRRRGHVRSQHREPRHDGSDRRPGSWACARVHPSRCGGGGDCRPLRIGRSWRARDRQDDLSRRRERARVVAFAGLGLARGRLDVRRHRRGSRRRLRNELRGRLRACQRRRRGRFTGRHALRVRTHHPRSGHVQPDEPRKRGRNAPRKRLHRLQRGAGFPGDGRELVRSERTGRCRGSTTT